MYLATFETKSCYIEHSKFVAIQGHLDLKNVHKTSEIYLPDGGSLNVTGFHGTLKARATRGDINFQLTELYGHSSIEADHPDSAIVNISEFVEEHTCIHAIAPVITLDDTLGHLSDNINIDGHLEVGNNDILEDKLIINSTGPLRIGKMSWMDTVKLQMK